jgi:glutaconate CoA-transferase subunit A
VAVIHAQRADKAGNVMIEGVLGVQKEAVLASRRSVVTSRKLIDELPERSLNAVVLPHWTVGPRRRGPRRCLSRPMRRAITRATTTSTRNGMQSRAERDSFQAWMKEKCALRKGPEAFAKYARKHRIAAE